MTQQSETGAALARALRRVALASGLGLAALPHAAHADEPAVSVAPFLWGPSLKGQVSQGPITIPLDLGIKDLANGIKGGGMVHAEVTTPGLHASVQAIYADFHDRRFTPVFGANVRSNLFTLEALAGPVVAAGPVKLSPMAGIRHTRIRGVFDAPGLGRLKAGNDWQEVLVGLEARAPLNRNLTLRTRATSAVGARAGKAVLT